MSNDKVAKKVSDHNFQYDLVNMSKEDLFKLDTSWTFRVNKVMLQRFQDVAKYNVGEDGSKALRDFMIKYIKENSNKSIF